MIINSCSVWQSSHLDLWWLVQADRDDPKVEQVFMSSNGQHRPSSQVFTCLYKACYSKKVLQQKERNPSQLIWGQYILKVNTSGSPVFWWLWEQKCKFPMPFLPLRPCKTIIAARLVIAAMLTSKRCCYCLKAEFLTRALWAEKIFSKNL